jgi:hypothetical protein
MAVVALTFLKIKYWGLNQNGYSINSGKNPQIQKKKKSVALFVEKCESPAAFAGLLHFSTNLVSINALLLLPNRGKSLMRPLFPRAFIQSWRVRLVSMNISVSLDEPSIRARKLYLSEHKIHYSSFVTLLLRTLKDAPSVVRLL